MKVKMMHVCEKVLTQATICEYEVKRLADEKVIRGKRKFNAIC